MPQKSEKYVSAYESVYFHIKRRDCENCYCVCKHVIRSGKGGKAYKFFKKKSYYSSTAQSFRCKQYSTVDGRHLPTETMSLSTRFESGTSELAFLFFLTA